MAGVAVAWAADLMPGDRAGRLTPASGTWYQRAGGGLTLMCAGLGAAPDLDLAFTAHRTATHSFSAMMAVAVVAAAIAAGAGRPIARVTLMCAAAYGSHLLLDWLGADFYPPRGLQLLWPFSQEWYISGLDVFRQTARLRIFTHGPMLTNVRAILQEVATLLPLLALLWWARSRQVEN